MRRNAGRVRCSGEGEDLEGIIIARFSKAAIVMDDQHEVHAVTCGPICSPRRWRSCLWQKSEQGAVVSTQLERQSEIKRPDVRGQLKAVAANVDLIIIVIAPEPEPFGNLIDRYLVAAYLGRH